MKNDNNKKQQLFAATEPETKLQSYELSFIYKKKIEHIT